MPKDSVYVIASSSRSILLDNSGMGHTSTRLNKFLVSPVMDPQIIHVDTVSMDWMGMFAYALPLFYPR